MRRILAMSFAAVFSLTLLAAMPAGADVKLPAVISNNMVLQADTKDAVWGWADPGEKVAVTLGPEKAEAAAGNDGRWQVRLGAMKAGGPFEMTVAGKNTIKLTNILVGEVWICSGQSNMAMSVKSSGNADQEIADAKYPKIRLFKVANATAEEPQTDVKGEWVECTPETVGGFSAAGYFFGRDLFKALGVPVGLIHTNWGGTPAEAWTSREGLEGNPALKAIYQRYKQNLANYPKQKEEWDKTRDARMATWKEAAAKAKAEKKPAPRAPQAPADPAKSPNSPSTLYNGMIAPLVPFGIRGAIWYQGESNAGRAYEYRTLFPAMIADWRKHWAEGDFPFIFVQLANFMARKEQPADSAWAELREAQAMTLALPKTGMAVIIDIGEAANIHPKNKQDVGGRLALAAETVAYGKTIVCSGPIYKSMSIEGDKIRLRFDHVGGGLVAKGDDAVIVKGPGGEPELQAKEGARLTGFAIAGADKKFVWADAKIDGDSVLVWAKDVPTPVAVRYAWADNPQCNLYNKAGLPASPFRTDQWPGITEGK